MGFTVSHYTILRRLKELAPFYVVKIQIKATLRRSGAFRIVMFDNSQLFQSLKYQRNQDSSTSPICTPRSFFLAIIPPDINKFRFPSSKTLLLYHHQEIPSAYGMPKYESILNRPISAAFLKLYISNEDCTDITGDCVNVYAVIFGIANTIHRFQRLILLKKEFQFQLPARLADMRALNINNVLAPNEINRNSGSSNNMFNIYMRIFQCRQTELCRGTALKTSLMIPPGRLE